VSGKTQLFCFRTLNSQAEVRLIEGLLNPQIRRSGDIPHFRKQFVRVDPVSVQVVPDNLNVDGSGQSKIENLPDHVGGQESE
jgi:hypothetical protein